MRGRRRNRASNNIQSESEVSSSESEINSTSVNNNQISQAKRGRGRPRKTTKQRIQDESNDEVSDNNDDNVTSTLPARRSLRSLANTRRNAQNPINGTTSPQPGTSNTQSNVQNGVDDDSDEEYSGSDVADSDTSVDKSSNKRKTPPGRRGRGRLLRNKRQRLPVDTDDDDDGDQTQPVSSSKPNNKFPTGSPGRSPSRRRITINGNLSPQPSTSYVNDSQAATQNGMVNDSSEESSGSETPDSDDLFNDIRTTSKVSDKRKRRTKKPVGKKQKLNSSSNGVNAYGKPLSQNKQSASNRKTSKDTSFDPKLVERLGQKVVYFLLIEDQKKYAIKKKAIITHVFKEEVYSTKLYNVVIAKANSILKKVYGMELMEVENQKDGYLIVNVLRRELGIDDYIELPRLKQQQLGLLLYLLTVIFMNGNTITEDELEKALKPLKIDLTTKIPHPIFGDVKKFITIELVKQMYLNYECVSKDPRRYEITWGVRAKEVVDKRDLLKFACQIMDDISPENWILQYRDAEKSASLV